MILEYPNKKTEAQIMDSIVEAELSKGFRESASGSLLFGDNLRILKALINRYSLAGKVDLVYIDPPFATNTLFKITNNRANTVSMCIVGDTAYSDILLGSDYIESLRARLIFLREILSDHGSIYLHIDYKIGHYVKIIMDEIFGKQNFRNDITRIKCNPKNFQRKAYGNIKDMVLFYTKSNEYTWNNPELPLGKSDKERLYKKIDYLGRRYTTIPLHAPGETQNGSTGREWRGLLPPKGRHWRCSPDELERLHNEGLIEWSKTGVPRKIVYADNAKTKKAQDVLEFKDPSYPIYPTQKNLDFLKMVISASSNPGDLILDCYCGSGTTLLAASSLGRRWIGIDNSNQAIAACRKAFSDEAFESLYSYMEEINNPTAERYGK